MAGNNGADPAIKIARPTINVGGQDSASLAQGLLSLLVAENTNGLYRCEAQFGNWGPTDNRLGFLYFDRQTLDFGKAFKVKLGTATIFDGRITAMEAQFPEGRPSELNVLAEDRFQDLRMTRRTRTFADVSDSDVIGQIANGHGLSPSVNVTGPTYKVLAQINQSDLAFLRERARAIDAELWMEGSTLNAKSRSNRNAGTLKMSYGKELREFTVLADLAGQRTSVAVNGWDVAGKSAIQYEATESVISNELNGDASGTSILQSALGQRKEALAHTVPLNSQEAQAEAEAFFRMSARRFMVGTGVADADSQLRVGAFVDLQGLGPLFSGKYYVSEIWHRFDGSGGLRTEFTSERPGIGRT
jgi:phage protein D